MKILKNLQNDTEFNTGKIINFFPDKIDIRGLYDTIPKLNGNIELEYVEGKDGVYPMYYIDLGNTIDIDYNKFAAYLLYKNNNNIIIEHLTKFKQLTYSNFKDIIDLNILTHNDYALLQDTDGHWKLWITSRISNELIDKSGVIFISYEGYFNNKNKLFTFQSNNKNRLLFGYNKMFLEIEEDDIKRVLPDKELYNQIKNVEIDSNTFNDYLNNKLNLPIIFGTKGIRVVKNGRLVNDTSPFWFSPFLEIYMFNLDVKKGRNNSDFIIDLQYNIMNDENRMIVPGSVIIPILTDNTEVYMAENEIEIPNNELYYQSLFYISSSEINKVNFKFSVDSMNIEYILKDEFYTILPYAAGGDNYQSYKAKLTGDQLTLFEYMSKLIEYSYQFNTIPDQTERENAIFHQLTNYIDRDNHSFLGGAYGIFKLYKKDTNGNWSELQTIDPNTSQNTVIGIVNYTNPSSLIFYRQTSGIEDILPFYWNAELDTKIKYAFSQFSLLRLIDWNNQTWIDYINDYIDIIDFDKKNNKIYTEIIWEWLSKIRVDTKNFKDMYTINLLNIPYDQLHYLYY